MKKIKKTVLIINGKGGVGKDTLINSLVDTYNIHIVSSIDPIKDIAFQLGWDGIKTPVARKFLSDLKRLSIQFNNYPTKFLIKQYWAFLDDDNDIMAVFIREPEEISKFKSLVPNAKSILIVRNECSTPIKWGNSSDDDVFSYNYDYYFENKLLEDSITRFHHLIQFIRTDSSYN